MQNFTRKVRLPENTKRDGCKRTRIKLEDKLCDPIHVSYRDGQYGIVEGQKRKLAKMMIDSDGTLVCHIYRGLTQEEEYQLFSQLNNGKRTYGSNEDYEARSKFDPKWKYVIECVAQAGFSIVYSGGAREKLLVVLLH